MPKMPRKRFYAQRRMKMKVEPYDARKVPRDEGTSGKRGEPEPVQVV